MKNLKEKLFEIIISKPEVLQFTKDRKFEEAWIISLTQKRPTQNEIDLYLTKEKFETLIVEYIWGSENDEERFVLTLFLDKKCQLQDPRKFINISLNNFYQYGSFQSLMHNFDSQVIGNPYLFMHSVESVNLSVFNHWLSVGPVDLWKSDDAYNVNTIINKIKSRPEIEKTNLNYQGLFFRFNIKGGFNGPYYGFKTPCCNKIKNEWIIDFEKIDYWMKIMLRL